MLRCAVLLHTRLMHALLHCWVASRAQAGGKKEQLSDSGPEATAAREVEEESHGLLPAALVRPLLREAPAVYVQESKMALFLLLLRGGERLPQAYQALVDSDRQHAQAKSCVRLAWWSMPELQAALDGRSWVSTPGRSVGVGRGAAVLPHVCHMLRQRPYLLMWVQMVARGAAEALVEMVLPLRRLTAAMHEVGTSAASDAQHDADVEPLERALNQLMLAGGVT